MFIIIALFIAVAAAWDFGASMYDGVGCDPQKLALQYGFTMPSLIQYGKCTPIGNLGYKLSCSDNFYQELYTDPTCSGTPSKTPLLPSGAGTCQDMSVLSLKYECSFTPAPDAIRIDFHSGTCGAVSDSNYVSSYFIAQNKCIFSFYKFTLAGDVLTWSMYSGLQCTGNVTQSGTYTRGVCESTATRRALPSQFSPAGAGTASYVGVGEGTRPGSNAFSFTVSVALMISVLALLF